MLVPRKQLQRGLVSAITLLLILILAAGVSSVELLPGRAFAPESFGGSDGFGLASRIHVPSALLAFLGSVLRVAIWVLLPFALIHFFRSRSARKRVLLQLFYLLLFAYALFSISEGLNLQRAAPTGLTPPNQSLPGAAAQPTTSIPVAPSWVFFVLSGAAASAIAYVGLRIYRSTQRDVHGVSAEARLALDALESGAKLEDVIQRAYQRLCQATLARRGIGRAKQTTAREFGGQLSSAGLPSRSLIVITRLFEKARYGNSPMDQEDERKAVAALRDILRALGEL
jgi:hypothetical protein